jgi:hypothetical protein
LEVVGEVGIPSSVVVQLLLNGLLERFNLNRNPMGKPESLLKGHSMLCRSEFNVQWPNSIFERFESWIGANPFEPRIDI